MEKLIFALLCLSSFSSTFGQKVTFGINMGLNYDYLQLKEDPSLAFPLNLTTEDKIGFQIGIHSLIHVADRVKLSPQAILAFSEYAYDYNIGNSTELPKSVKAMKMASVPFCTPLSIVMEIDCFRFSWNNLAAK